MILDAESERYRAAITRQTLLDATTSFPNPGCFSEATIGSMNLPQLRRQESPLKSQGSCSSGGNVTYRGDLTKRSHDFDLGHADRLINSS